MIDAHHHFWKYKPADFPWITEEVKLLQQDHQVDDFELDLEFSGIDQVISVQSRCSDRENHFLLEQAKKSDNLVAGIVGWAPLDSDEIRIFLDQYLHEPMLKGVREIITGTPEQKFLNNPDFDQGMKELLRHNLAFDLMVSEPQLSAAIAFADRHPDQRIVLNHCGCPQIQPDRFSTSWARSIRELARRPHVYCKLSGLSSQLPHDTGRSTHSQILRPYFDTVCNAFSPARMMYGSNWPICKLNTTYPAWLNTVDDLIVSLSEDERQAIHQDTAIGFYQL
ncbi:MAG: amidohydrolase family protein [Akkermansiaceae bacterium]